MPTVSKQVLATVKDVDTVLPLASACRRIQKPWRPGSRSCLGSEGLAAWRLSTFAQDPETAPCMECLIRRPARSVSRSSCAPWGLRRTAWPMEIGVPQRRLHGESPAGGALLGRVRSACRTPLRSRRVLPMDLSSNDDDAQGRGLQGPGRRAPGRPARGPCRRRCRR